MRLDNDIATIAKVHCQQAVGEQSGTYQRGAGNFMNDYGAQLPKPGHCRAVNAQSLLAVRQAYGTITVVSQAKFLNNIAG